MMNVYVLPLLISELHLRVPVSLESAHLLAPEAASKRGLASFCECGCVLVANEDFRARKNNFLAERVPET